MSASIKHQVNSWISTEININLLRLSDYKTLSKIALNYIVDNQTNDFHDKFIYH